MFSFFPPFLSIILSFRRMRGSDNPAPAPMPQLLSSMALCLFREGPITLSGVTPRSKRETEWKFIGRWRRGGEAERKGETRVMDEFDTLARAMWNASAFRLQMTTAKPGFFLYLSLSLFFSAFLPWPAGRREKKGTNNIWMQIQKALILHRCLSAIAQGVCTWFEKQVV